MLSSVALFLKLLMHLTSTERTMYEKCLAESGIYAQKKDADEERR